MKQITVLLTSLFALVGLGTLAHAKKPTVAILGLEVIDNGAVDKRATQAAQGLAEAMRAEASNPAGKYSLAIDSAKDLLEMKLLSDCGDEGKTCMASIGAELNADRLLYGKLERHKNDYQISLNLFNTHTKQMETQTSELVDIEDLHSSKINRWARSLYARLIGAPQTGTLRVDANVDKATIYVDGQVATTLRDGSAKVDNLDEGVHKVAIEADGFKRYEAEVAITSGSTEGLSVSMSATKSAGGSSSETHDGRGTWKAAFYGSAATTVALGLGWGYYGFQAGYLGGDSLEAEKQRAWQALETGDRETAAMIAMEGQTGTNQSFIADSCGIAADIQGNEGAELRAFVQACADGQTAADRATYLAIGTAVFGLASAYLGYQAFLAGDAEERQFSDKGKAQHNRGLAVIPQLTPNSVGAGVLLDF